jgi:hypothetical protein
MRKTIRLLILFVLLFAADKGYAQMNPQSVDSTILSGHFEMDTVIGSDTHHINVNYVLSPMPLSTTMNVQLNTANNVLFNVDVVDATNAVVATWTPSAISNTYDTNIDISSLSSGSYTVKIRKYNTTDVLNSISITKP